MKYGIGHSWTKCGAGVDFAIAEAVCCWFLTAEAKVQSQINLWGLWLAGWHWGRVFF